MGTSYRDRFADSTLGIEDELVVELPSADTTLFEDLAHGLDVGRMRTFERALHPSLRPGRASLVARRHAFGWTLHARGLTEPSWGSGHPQRIERLLHHEVVSGEAVHVLRAHEAIHGRSVVPEDPKFLWRSTEGRRDRSPWLGQTCLARSLHRTLLAIERHRLDALDRAHAALERLPIRAASLAYVSIPLREVALEAMALDSTGRIAQAAASRPAFLHALGLALGNRPGAWTYGGELASPLRLLVEGRKDRDVLAEALEVACGREPSAALLSRLRALGTRMDASTWLLGYLANTLDVSCPDSWLPEHDDALDTWAYAQCWARACQVPPDLRPAFERYVARYGAEIGTTLVNGSRHPATHEVFEQRLPRRAHALLHQRIAPLAFFRQELHRGLPEWEGDAFLPDSGPYELRRLRSGDELRILGRRFANCLGDPHTDLGVRCVVADRIHFEVRWPDGEAVAELVPCADSWRLGQILGPRNRDLPKEVREGIRLQLQTVLDRLDLARLMRYERPRSTMGHACEREAS